MNSVRNKHRKDCILCRNMSASTPAFGWIVHPMSGQLMGLCFRHTVSLTRTPKHAETDDQPYTTAGSWKLVKSLTNGKVRQRWMPIRSEEFEIKSNGWRTHIQKDGGQKWEWEPGDEVHINWQLVTGTHGHLPRPAKSFRDSKVVTPFRYIKKEQFIGPKDINNELISRDRWDR